MRSNSSSGRRSFSRYPSAPLFIAWNRSSSSSEIVRTTTLVSGHSLLIRRVASTPLQTGIWISISTTSGLEDRTCSTAINPSEASPTTSKPSWSSRRARSPFRKRSWSSTRSIRTGVMVLSLRQRQEYPYRRPAAGAGFDLQPPADPLHSLPHGAQAETRAVLVQNDRIEAAALVLNAYADLARLTGDADPGPIRLGVLADVGQGLLDDPDQLHLRFRRELRRRVTLYLKLGGDAGLTSELLEVLPQRANDSPSGRDRLPKAEDRLADVHIRLVGEGRHLREFIIGAGRLSAIKVALRRLRFKVKVAQDLGEAIVHLLGQPLPLLQHRHVPLLLQQPRVVDGDGRHVRQTGKEHPLSLAELSRRAAGDAQLTDPGVADDQGRRKVARTVSLGHRQARRTPGRRGGSFGLDEKCPRERRDRRRRPLERLPGAAAVDQRQPA